MSGHRIGVWLRRIALGLSAGYILEYLTLVVLRIGHPYDLEWEEGAMVDQVVRIGQGLPLYVEPSIEFVPQLYTPLYFYVSAGVAALIGDGFVPLRLVSVLSSLACMGFVAALARRESADPAAGLLAVGFFAATYRLAAAFLDIARVDSLFLLLSIMAIYVVRTRPSVRGAALAGVLFWLSFLTKQSGALLVIPMALYLWASRGATRAGSMMLAFAAPTAASMWGLHALSDGWSFYYLYEMPSGHTIFTPMLILFWWIDLLKPMAPACGLAMACIIISWRKVDHERRQGLAGYDEPLFWLFFLGAFVAVSWFSRIHWGGATNVVLPAYLCIAVAWGVGLTRFTRGAPSVRFLGLWALCVFQLVGLAYDPRPLVPGDREAGDQFVAGLAEIEGEVLTPFHGWVPSLAGKRVYAHLSGIYDVMRAGPNPIAKKLGREINEALERQDFSAVVIDLPLAAHDYLRDPLVRNYKDTGPMLDKGLRVGGIPGYPANPRLYRPRIPPAARPSSVQQHP